MFKAPPAPAAVYEPRWTAWGGAYGGSNRTTGDILISGSNDLSASTAGYAGGLDYHLTRDTLIGFALAGGGTNWSLSEGLGGGKSDAFQAGLYGATRWGPAYLAAAFAFANHWMSTDRFAFEGDHLTANFNAQSFGGRVEGGYRFATMFGGLTPYAALQAQSFHTPGYSETDTNGGGSKAGRGRSPAATAALAAVGGSPVGGGGGGAGGYGAIVTGAGSSNNTGSITGGNGGAGGRGGGPAFASVGGNGGDGGVGVQFTAGISVTFVNTGTVTGGNGGAGAASDFTPGKNGAGGAGVVGAGLTIVNNGTIMGGLSGDGVTRADAIIFTGGTNFLAGTGTVGSFTMIRGSTFAPGSFTFCFISVVSCQATPGTSMTVAGNLAFQSGAFYLVQVNPTATSFATVTGTASLAGTVQAVFARGATTRAPIRS